MNIIFYKSDVQTKLVPKVFGFEIISCISLEVTTLNLRLLFICGRWVVCEVGIITWKFTIYFCRDCLKIFGFLIVYCVFPVGFYFIRRVVYSAFVKFLFGFRNIFLQATVVDRKVIEKAVHRFRSFSNLYVLISRYSSKNQI